MSDNGKIFIFDTTLRDGEQAPGASMNMEEKLRIASVLDRMGIDIIEAGFPGSSQGDFEAVQAVAAATKNAIVAGLSRAVRADIDACVNALRPARRKRIHTFISTSPLHMEYKLRMTPDEVHAAVVDSVSYARNLCDDVEWSCEDGTRSDRDFLCRCFESAIKAGASTVNIADTVGYTMPGEFDELIRYIMNRVPNIDKVRFSVHCHDDLGMGVANSLAAISAGARQIECTVNGIGERAGNASMEEIVMALDVRRDLLKCHTEIDTRYLFEASQLVSGITGFPVPPNKAVVGSNAFAHESGIHQHGVINHRATYEIMDASAVGAGESTLVMGKHSGRHAFLVKLNELGLNLGEDAFENAFNEFKTFADSRKTVTDDEMLALAHRDRTAKSQGTPELKAISVQADSAGSSSARLQIVRGGILEICEGRSANPMDAIAAAFRRLYAYPAVLAGYEVNQVSENGQLVTRSTVTLTSGAVEAVAHATSNDAFTAFANAYLAAAMDIQDRMDTAQLSRVA